MAKIVTKKKEIVPPPPIEVEEEFGELEVGTRSLEVPGARRGPIGQVQGGMYWIYGVEKIGKTTIASRFPGVWFWATEPGQNWLSDVYEPTLLQDWDHVLELCNMVQSKRLTKFGDGKPIRTICIDTVDLLYKMCETHVTRQLGVDSLFDNDDRGKGWNRLSTEFERVITGIRRWPFTLVCLSHARQKPFKTRGRSTDRMEPDVGAGARRTLSAAADLILYAYPDDEVIYDDEGTATGSHEVRKLQCHPNASAVAGGRMSHLLPKNIVMDYNELNAYLTGTKTVEET